MYMAGKAGILFGLLLPASASIAIAAGSYLSGTILKSMSKQLESKYALADFEIYAKTLKNATESLRNFRKLVEIQLNECIKNRKPESILYLRQLIADEFSMKKLSQPGGYQTELHTKFEEDKMPQSVQIGNNNEPIIKHTTKSETDDEYLTDYYKEYITTDGWMMINRMEQSEVESVEELQNEMESAIKINVYGAYNQINDYYKL